MRKSVCIVLLLVALFDFSCRVKHEDLKQKSDKILDDIANGTATADFSEKYFPKDQTTFLLGQLQNYCDFKDRKGNFVNDFHETGIGTPDKIGYIYEFYLKCDTMRIIFTYLANGANELYKLDIEKATKDNPKILFPERRLIKPNDDH
jgi:hypothetical protein